MTASLPQSHHDYTFGDYLALERESEIKHEFDGGEILAMSGGTARHSALAANIVIALGTTRGPGCTVFKSDMRVRVVATGRATYPDASMVCGPLEYDPDDAAHTTITNPSLIVEVLSVTTEKGDRGNKWMHYQERQRHGVRASFFAEKRSPDPCPAPRNNFIVIDVVCNNADGRLATNSGEDGQKRTTCILPRGQAWSNRRSLNDNGGKSCHSDGSTCHSRGAGVPLQWQELPLDREK
ncbi:MAG TPA: Uma2 family endonuclease [Thermoanaerobaculia bacterium]|nr:Uma2 family endonuclease [Thermoanaerobaculia bacterium]